MSAQLQDSVASGLTDHTIQTEMLTNLRRRVKVLEGENERLKARVNELRHAKYHADRARRKNLKLSQEIQRLTDLCARDDATGILRSELSRTQDANARLLRRLERANKETGGGY